MKSNHITGPSINRFHSKQDYCTPRNFFDSVEKRFGLMDFDLSASRDNTLVPGKYYSLKQNSLKQDWMKLEGNLWLNPPFGDLEPWARKCACSFTRKNVIFLLSPASVGSNWFRECVASSAKLVLFLSPRLCFDGKG